MGVKEELGKKNKANEIKSRFNPRAISRGS